jgi:hypothetical protein
LADGLEEKNEVPHEAGEECAHQDAGEEEGKALMPGERGDGRRAEGFQKETAAEVFIG